MLKYQISNSSRFLFSCFLFTASLFAQTKAPPFYVIPDQGKVYIILASPPKEMVGFSVYRKDKAEKEFKPLLTEPIMSINDPLIARDVLGEAEYNWIANALKVEDEFSFLRRLQDPGIGGALSLVSLKVAKVLGKVFIDTAVKTGLEYTYRVAFLNYQEEEFSTIDEKVVVQKHKGPDKRVGKISISISKKNLKLDWEYPKWQADKSDLVVGFNIYRKTDEDKEFKKVLPFPYLRTSEKLFYLDKNVEQGKTYQFYLTPVDLIGAEGPKSEIVIIKLKDITPPKPPLNVTATPDGGRIVIKWEPSPDEDVVGYNIYRSWSIHGQFTKLNPKPIPKEIGSFIDKDVVTGALHVYRLSAIDKAGLEGKHSTAVFSSPKDTTPPPPVSGLTAKVEKRMVSLSWHSQMTPDLDGYYIYRAEKKDDLFRLVGSPIKKDMPIFTDSGFAQKGLYPGRTYYYYVSSIDIALNEGKKSMIEIKIPDDEPPMAPASIYCKNNDDGTVEVIWQISLSADLAKYRIHRQEPGKEILLLKEVDINTNRYLDKTCERGKKYFYFVSGVDSVGNQGEQLKFEIIPKDIMAPPVPKGLKVIYDKKRVNLTWEKVMADDLVGYNVYRSHLPTGIYEKLNKTILKNESFSDLDGKRDYYYRVSSLDTSGNESDKTAPFKPELHGE